MANDTHWYKDAVIYQTHVRAFHDSNADGIGDFKGLTEKLDYLEGLGVTAIWLLPFYPSPLKDDGYDIADYTAIHPAYGSLRDFDVFLREAHRRGLRVITELVINHTSDQHPWFQRARRAPAGSRERDYYVWSETTDRYRGTRIIFKDFEPSNWSPDALAGAYYWHRFYSHQPDLNFESEEVRRELFKVLDFWCKRGVDGLRLDAIPYLYEREGTSCENLPETHRFLKELRAHVDARHPGRMLLAEANQWPEDAVAYFGDGDECHMAFHFPLMPRLFMAMRMEDRYPILDILEQTPAIPPSAQWAMFLRNHDELTLEMVTDRERDYMYQVFARDREMRINLGIRRRLAPLLGGDRRTIELMNSLLMSMPGTPVLYYGDEIGMGDNVYLGDRNGVRTPMQWSPDRNAGFSRANPQRLYLPVIIDPEYHYEAVNVEAQQNSPRSLLWWMRHLIALRRRYRAFSRGEIEFLQPDNTKVLAFLRTYEDERILVVANLSRHAQHVALDLRRFAGSQPVELFGQTAFPPIEEERAWSLTLAPHSFYWFALERPRVTAAEPDAARGDVAELTVERGWEDLLERRRGQLERVLPAFLGTRRWFAGKARGLRGARVTEVVRLPATLGTAVLLLVEVEYADESRDTYSVPLALLPGNEADAFAAAKPEAVFARVSGGRGRGGLLVDALWHPRFTSGLLTVLGRRQEIEGGGGRLVAAPARGRRPAKAGEELPPKVSKAEQSNTSVLFGQRLILKLFRRLEAGINPDLEVGRFLTETARYPHTPAVVGTLEYHRGTGDPISLALLQEFVPNEGDAWSYTLEALGRYFERAVAHGAGPGDGPPPPGHPWPASEEPLPDLARELLGFYVDRARLLGERTGQLHCALASDAADPAFAPEPYTGFFQRAQYQALRGQVTTVGRLLRGRLSSLPDDVRPEAEQVAALQDALVGRFASLRDRQLTGQRIRIHGDFHLGQVLYTGKDFVIIDFEGEPARSLAERRGKTSPLRDVAGMLRSFHYASFTVVREGTEAGGLPADMAALEPWRAFWFGWIAASYLRGYRDAVAGAAFLPRDDDELRELLDAYALDKAIYELSYELNHRPSWVRIPLRGILEIAASTG
jgi:maltose alpha-D-glucosyltransferase/alpha-amylase